jgi:hypothetical protein
MDLAERLAALSSRNDEPLERDYSDEEAKEAFLELLAEGFTPPKAAKMVGRTATWFRRRRNPEGAHFDPEFRDAYERVMAPDGENRAAIVEDARTALIEEAKRGNVRAIEKLLMAFDPEFSFMRPAQFQGDLNIERFQVLLPQIPTELLLQMKEALQRGQQPELGVGEP